MSFKPGKWEEGFTLVEVLAAVVVLGMVLGLGGWLSNRCMTSIRKAGETEKFLKELALFDEFFRKETAKVVVPWWESPADFMMEKNSLTLNWIGEKRDSRVIFRFEENGLSIVKNESVTLLFPALLKGGFFPLGEAGSITGAGVVFPQNGREFRVTGSFGGVPLTVSPPPAGTVIPGGGEDGGLDD